MRPVVRLPAPANPGDPPAAWMFTGGGEAVLTLDGLFVSGGDIILRGAFASVRLTGFTADPGTAGEDGLGFATSVDGRMLAPTRIWIEADPASAGAIGQLLIDHCVLGPVRTRNGGAVDSTSISDSVIQGLAPQPSAGQTLMTADVYDPELLAAALKSPSALSTRLLQSLPSAAQAAVEGYTGGILPDALLAAILDGLNTLISGRRASTTRRRSPASRSLPACRHCWRREPPPASRHSTGRCCNRRSRWPCARRRSRSRQARRAGAHDGDRRHVRPSPSVERLDPHRVHPRRGRAGRLRAVPARSSAGSFMPRRYLSALDRPGRAAIHQHRVRRARLRAAARGRRPRDRQRAGRRDDHRRGGERIGDGRLLAASSPRSRRTAC